MIEVNIKRIRIEGFRSYTSPVVFSFETTGLFSISGLNGAGKTSLFSALLWCLYGTNLNETNNDAIQTFAWLRPNDYRGTRVITEMTVGDKKYFIARHLNYSGKTVGIEGESRLMLLEKPVKDKNKWAASYMLDKLYKNDQQLFINSLLGLTPKAFINSIIFGQGLSRLVRASGTEKRLLFEDLFELDFIEEAKEKAIKDKTQKEVMLADLSLKIAGLNERYAAKAQQIEAQADVLNTFYEDKKRRLDEIRNDHKTVKAQYNYAVSEYNILVEAEEAKTKKKKTSNPATPLKDLLQTADLAEAAVGNMRNKITDTKRQVEIADRNALEKDNQVADLAHRLRNLKDTCPTCGGKLDAKKIALSKKTILAEIEAIENAKREIYWQRAKYVEYIAKLETELVIAKEDFRKAFDTYTAAKESFVPEPIVNHNIAILNERISQLGQRKASLKERFEAERAKEPPEIDLKSMEAQLLDMQATLEDKQKECTTLEGEIANIKWWIDEGFSSKGLKSYIFSAMLHKLNEFVLEYAGYFGYIIRFGVDLTKKSKPFTTTILDGDNEIDYLDLSGGQKQRVDVCLAFAMHDLVSCKTSFNIMVMDEISENLDADGVAMVNTVITEKAKTKALYIITHNPLHSLTPDQAFTIVGGDQKQPSKIE